MTRYHFTAPQFAGHIVLGYRLVVCKNVLGNHNDGVLYLIDMEAAQFPEDQTDMYTDGVMRAVPLYEFDLDKFAAEKPGRKITHVPDKPPEFAEFWAAYAKGNSEFVGSKAKAETSWKALSVTEKIAALKFIPKYLRHKADTNQNLAYAATFLNQKSWQ